MRGKRQKKTIRRELFGSYSVLIALVLTLCIAIFFAVFLTQIEKQMREYNVSLSNRLALQLDNEVKRMDEVAQRIIFSPEVKELFVEKFTEEQKEERYENQLKLAELVNSLSGPTYRLSQVNLLSSTRCLSIQGYSSVREQEPAPGLNWTPKSHRGNRILLSPSMKEDKTLTFSLIRDLALPSFYQETGFVEVRQSYQVFDDIVHSSWKKPASQDANAVYIFTEEGELVYPYGGGELEGDCLSFAKKAAAQPDASPSQLRICRGRLEIYSCARASNTGWYVVMVDAQGLLDSSITLYLGGILLGGVLMLWLALMVSYLISRRITRPISQLHRQIQSMNPVTLQSTLPKMAGGAFNEIEQLNFAFLNLCEELEKSADEAASARAYLLQAKLLALQSQMNPHFLYNTLSAISIMAEEEGAVQSMGMILALSDMLSYVSGGDMSPVELGTELAYTENFLSLLKIRFEDQIEVQIDLPKPLLQIKIPKLILEPLVENWSKYGMNGSGISRLDIRGEMGGGHWKITVSDNGPGFSQAVLEGLEQQMSRVMEEGKIPDLQIHKMGLLNIFIRLHYAYGSQGVFTVANTPQGSGQICIGGTYYDGEHAD